MVKKRLKRGFVVSAASIICLSCLLSVGVKAEVEEQSNKLVIDLVKLAPYAQWDNYYGEIKFGHFQDKINCALYNEVDGTRTILMSPQYKEGYVRGKYTLFLPKAEKLLFKTNFFAGETKHLSCSISVGYFLKGKGSTYLIKDKKTSPSECDFTNLSGQKCNIFLKTKGCSRTGSFTNWDGTQIIALYPEKGMCDLAVSPSDIEIIPLADTRVNIQVTVQNIGNVKAGKFMVKLYDGDNLLGKKAAVSLSGKEEVSLSWGPFDIKEGAHKITAEIVSGAEENSKDNNKAVLFCKAPIYGMRFKNIKGYPEPWKVEEVKVRITNNLTDTADYKLIYRLYDYWGKKIKSVEHNIPQDADSITLKPFTDKKVGWWRMKTSIVYKNKIVDSLSDTFCKVPMPPAKARKDSIFQIISTCSRPPQMIKDTGTSYVHCNWSYRSYDPKKRDRCDKRAISTIDEVIKNGQIPYVIVLQGFCLDLKKLKKMELTKMVEEAKKFGYKAASKYSHKKTGIWWYIMGEVNPRISPHDYAAVVRAFYEGAVKADPNVRIATMEMTHCSPSLLDSGKRGTRYEWLAEMYPQARGCFHAVGNNFYSFLPPEEPFHNAIVKPCIDVIEKYGDLGKIEMHLQEGALPGLTGIGTIPASMVRTYLYQLGLGERGASIIAWFCIQDYHTPITTGRRGLCKFNRHPRPIYQAYAVMTQNLTGVKFTEKKDIGKDRYCYVFKKGRDILTCLWKGKGREKGKREVIVVPAKGEVEITNLMGEVTRIKPEKGKVELTILGYSLD